MLALIIFFWIYKLKPAQLIVILTLGSAMMLFAPPTYYQRILSIADIFPSGPNGGINIYEDRAVQGRASENLTAWVMLMDRPFTGVGLSNFSYLYQDYSKSLGLAPSARNRSPHNLYLEVAAETGVIGLAFF